MRECHVRFLDGEPPIFHHQTNGRWTIRALDERRAIHNAVHFDGRLGWRRILCHCMGGHSHAVATTADGQVLRIATGPLSIRYCAAAHFVVRLASTAVFDVEVARLSRRNLRLPVKFQAPAPVALLREVLRPGIEAGNKSWPSGPQ